MSKIRTPWNRVPTVGLVPQSTRARVSSTDMNSRLPWTDRSPCPPGHTTLVTFVGRGRVGDVVDVEPVEVADEGVVAAEGEVGGHEREVARVGGVDEARRLVVVGTLLEVADGRLGVEPARHRDRPAGRRSAWAPALAGARTPATSAAAAASPISRAPAAASTYDITRHVSGLPRARRPPRPPIRALECAVRLRTVVRPPELGDELSCHHGGDELWDAVPAHPPGATAVGDRYVRPTGQETPVPPRPQ